MPLSQYAPARAFDHLFCVRLKGCNPRAFVLARRGQQHDVFNKPLLDEGCTKLRATFAQQARDATMAKDRRVDFIELTK